MPVVLLSDFGDSVYAGVIKGVLHSLCPGVTTIDLCHSVRPQNVREGAWLLQSAYAYFPAGSIFCAVVDPGVGAERAALAARAGRYFFVGPDNGLLAPALCAAAAGSAVQTVGLPIPPGAAATFHGRDVFAPAAARLAAGAPLSELGPATAPRHDLTFFRQGCTGEVVTVDRFGNIITNLPPEEGKTLYRVRLLPPGAAADAPAIWQADLRLYPTYAAAPAGQPVLVTGSAGTLEVAVAGGNAARDLTAEPGWRISAAPL